MSAAGVDVEGLPRVERRELITWLQQFAIQPAFVYVHRWRVGDALLWDNRCLLHCAMPFDDDRHRRHMHRTTLEGTVPFYGKVRWAVAAAAYPTDRACCDGSQHGCHDLARWNL